MLRYIQTLTTSYIFTIEAHLSSVAQDRLPEPLDSCAKGNGAEGGTAGMCHPGCVLNKGTTVIAFAAMKRYQIFPFTLGFRRTKGKCPYQQIRRFFKTGFFYPQALGFLFGKSIFSRSEAYSVLSSNSERMYRK